MVTEKEMAERVFVTPKEKQGTSSYVTAGEMKRFEQNKDLNNEVRKVIDKYVEKNNIKPKYQEERTSTQQQCKHISKNK